MYRCLAPFYAIWGYTGGGRTCSSEEKAKTLTEIISDASFHSMQIQHIHEEEPRHEEVRGSCFGDHKV
jgi:hypothetical protein